MKRPAAAALLVGLGYLALAVWITWPLAPRATDSLVSLAPGDQVAALGQADHLLNLWILTWGVHALGTAPTRFFDANIYHPLREALATGEHMLGAQPWFAPLYLATGNPIAAANGLVFLSFVAGGLGGYALVVALTGRRAAGAVAGLVFAFAPWRFFWLVHLQLVGVHLLPFVLLALHRALTDGRPRYVLGFALLLGLQALGSYYVGYMCALVGSAVVAYLPAPGAPAGARRRWLATVASGVAAALLVAALSAPYLRQAAAGVVPSGADAQSGAWLSIASLRPEQLLAGEGVGLGWAALALAAVGLWPWPGLQRFQAAALWIALWGVLLACGPAWGGTPLPWTWLARWVPGFSTLRVPGRFLIVATLGVAALAGLGTARIEGLLARRLPRSLAAAAPLAFVLVCFVPHRAQHAVVRFPTLAEASPAHRWLALHGDGGPLLELPMGWGFPGAAAEARAEYFSVVHRLPLLNGYNGYQPPFHAVYAELAARLPEPEALQTLVDVVDVRWLLVHLPADAAVRRRWDALPAGLEVAAAFDDARVLRVTRGPRADWRAHLRARGLETTTFAGLPIAPVPPAGRVATLEADVPPRAAAARPLPATVRVENRGAVAWPCFAVREEGPVRLWWRWRDGAGRVVAPSGGVRIAQDLAPGAATLVPFVAWTPAEVGVYALEVSVGQGTEDAAGGWRAGERPTPVMIGAP